MPDAVRRSINLPAIPEGIDASVASYLIELHRCLRDYLDGDVHISGNLYVEGGIAADEMVAGEFIQRSS